MVEVTDASFLCWREKISAVITNSSFVAIDFEFLGLDSSKNSLFHSPKDRYHVLRKSVMKYHPCQLGISCFHQDSNGRFIADVFSFDLLKRYNCQDTKISHSSVQFLMNNSFDVNKLFSNGVPFCDRKTLVELQENMQRGNMNASDFGSRLQDKLKVIYLEICEYMLNETSCEGVDGEWFNNSDRNVLSRLTSFDIRLCDETGKRLWNQPLTSLESAYVLFNLSAVFPYLHFEIDSAIKSIRVTIKLDHTYRGEIKSHVERLVSAVHGVSYLFELISSNSIPVVGHNSLLDFMYIYHYFIDTLPHSYNDFKQNLHSLFPIILDSKILANSVADVLHAKGVLGTSLEELGTFFDSEEADKLIPTSLHKIHAGLYAQDIFPDGGSYHNAAFDSLITGEVFIKMAHILANISGSSQKLWTMERLLQICRPIITNRISMSLIDVNCCFLNESDPAGFRPDYIGLRRKNIPLEISNEEFKMEFKRLSRLLDSYQFDVRLSSDRKTFAVATNTATTYARVCEKYSRSENFVLIDEVGLTENISYEQRLTGCRAEKEGLSIDCGSSPSIWKKILKCFVLPAIGFSFTITVFL